MPTLYRASQIAQLIKNPPAMQETPVQFQGREDLIEKGKATHSSILAWSHKEWDRTELSLSLYSLYMPSVQFILLLKILMQIKAGSLWNKTIIPLIVSEFFPLYINGNSNFIYV